MALSSRIVTNAQRNLMMSRGPGTMQRYLVHIIRVHGKPATFAELRGIVLKAENPPASASLRASLERSFRRALQGLLRDLVIMQLGSGGRDNPHRYCLHPTAAAIICDKAEFDALTAVLEAETKV
jgi:hypothetical protein